MIIEDKALQTSPPEWVSGALLCRQSVCLFVCPFFASFTILSLLSLNPLVSLIAFYQQKTLKVHYGDSSNASSFGSSVYCRDAVLSPSNTKLTSLMTSRIQYKTHWSHFIWLPWVIVQLQYFARLSASLTKTLDPQPKSWLCCHSFRKEVTILVTVRQIILFPQILGRNTRSGFKLRS